MCPLESAVYETNIPNAYLVPAGREVFSSLQLLASPRFGRMIAQLRKQFDVVLVDTPPAGVIVDATGSYTSSFLLAGVIAAMGGLCYAFLVRKPVHADA